MARFSNNSVLHWGGYTPSYRSVVLPRRLYVCVCVFSQARLLTLQGYKLHAVDWSCNTYMKMLIGPFVTHASIHILKRQPVFDCLMASVMPCLGLLGGNGDAMWSNYVDIKLNTCRELQVKLKESWRLFLQKRKQCSLEFSYVGKTINDTLLPDCMGSCATFHSCFSLRFHCSKNLQWPQQSSCSLLEYTSFLVTWLSRRVSANKPQLPPYFHWSRKQEMRKYHTSAKYCPRLY